MRRPPPTRAGVHGWVLKPAGTGPFPVVLMVHGGPFAHYGWTLFDEAQVYAGAGYAVVMGNPRGSAGHGESHGRAIVGDFGNLDSQDVLALLDAALQDPDLDGDRVGVMGGSYGGFMTTWLVGHTDRFRAAISERACNAFDSFEGSSDIGWFFVPVYNGTDPARVAAQSPLSYVDRIRTPMLLIHSEQDSRCPIEQAQRLFVALKQRNAPRRSPPGRRPRRPARRAPPWRRCPAISSRTRPSPTSCASAAGSTGESAGSASPRRAISSPVTQLASAPASAPPPAAATTSS